MSTLQKYKYATVLLSAAVVILIVMLWDAQDVMVLLGRDQNTMNQVQDDLASCQDNIESWSAQNSGKTLSAEARNQLSDILSECNADAKEGVAATR